MKSVIRFVSKNKFLHLVLGFVTFFAGLSEAWETISEDIISGRFHSAHGVIAIGVWHMCCSISEIIEASKYLDEGL